MTTRHWLMAVLTSLAVAAAGCGGDGDTATTAPDTTPRETAAAATTTSTAALAPTTTAPDGPVAGAATLTVANSPLGPIVVDGAGRTLYVFLNDEEFVSNCGGPCIETWPRLEAEIIDGADGIDRSLLGTTTSTPDNRSQATYNGRPLYYYVADTGPGDTEGQGVGGVWFVISPEGEPVGA